MYFPGRETHIFLSHITSFEFHDFFTHFSLFFPALGSESHMFCLLAVGKSAVPWSRHKLVACRCLYGLIWSLLLSMLYEIVSSFHRLVFTWVKVIPTIQRGLCGGERRGRVSLHDSRAATAKKCTRKCATRAKLSISLLGLACTRICIFFKTRERFPPPPFFF